MHTTTAEAPWDDTIPGLDLHSMQQPVKWLVYSLLVVNFGFYIYEDIDYAPTIPVENASSLCDFADIEAIEMNVSEWRKEILFENSGLAAARVDRIG